MSNITWDKLSISFPYTFGQITEKRVNKTANMLNEAGIKIMATMLPSPGVCLYVQSENKGVIIISENSISYNITANEYNRMKKNLQIIADVFSVEDMIPYVINFEGESNSENTHINSVNMFNNKMNIELGNQIYGVGYRFLFKRDFYDGEYKVEPMIEDSSKMYFQLIINIPGSLTIDEAFEVIEREVDEIDQMAKIV